MNKILNDIIDSLFPNRHIAITPEIMLLISEFATEEVFEYDKDGKITSSTMMWMGHKHGKHKQWQWEQSICHLISLREYVLGLLWGKSYTWDNTCIGTLSEYVNGKQHGTALIHTNTEFIIRETYDTGRLLEYIEYSRLDGSIARIKRSILDCEPYMVVIFNISMNGKLLTDHTYDKETNTYVITEYTRYGKENIKTRSVTIRNGKFNGPKITYASNNKIHTISMYVDNLLHGDYITYDEEGDVREYKTYVNNKLCGELRRMFCKDKIEYTQMYKDDMKHGEYKRYNTDGCLVASYNYVNGILHGDYVLKGDHHVNRSGTYCRYNMGMLDGLYKEFDYSGKLIHEFTMNNGILQGNYLLIGCCYRMVETYLDGKLHGEHRTYNRGKLRYRAQFVNGLRHGPYETYLYDQLHKTDMYENGFLIHSTTHSIIRPTDESSLGIECDDICTLLKNKR